VGDPSIVASRVGIMRFKHIAIVGVGLIGGSFALAARRAGFADRITGWDSKQVLDQACERGVIDGVEFSFSAGSVSEADLIYLAAPVRAIIEFLHTRGSSLKHGAIITDAGSTKAQICRAAREALPEHVSFVGGHPMAGSHNAGVEYAEADLFRDAPYALVVDESNDRSIWAARSIADVVRGIGARPVMLTAEEHDRAVARLSHAPQLLATALACRVNEADLRLAGGGFTEMARLAGSRWSVWEDICRTNADEIASALDEVIGEMEAVRSSISSGDFAAVGAAFGEANGLMERLQPTSKRNDAAAGRPEEEETDGVG
jgi:prephenate dehydrogenase